MCKNIVKASLLAFKASGSPLRVQEHCLDRLDSHSIHRDHPCVCRNIMGNKWATNYRLGSPLRVQEHYKDYVTFINIFGITPACAGTFTEIPSGNSCSRDHPCVCRNILDELAKPSVDLGSPLRVQEHFVYPNWLS